MIVEEVAFCGCTNEELEAGRTCGQPQCPNAGRSQIGLPTDMTPDDAYVQGIADTEERMGGLAPLVIVGIGGGLVQWDVVKSGVGMPRVHYLDYDREGEPPEETAEFVDRIEEARNDLMAFEDPEDAETIENMDESIAEYREMIARGDSPGRYR